MLIATLWLHARPPVAPTPVTEAGEIDSHRSAETGQPNGRARPLPGRPRQLTPPANTAVRPVSIPLRDLDPIDRLLVEQPREGGRLRNLAHQVLLDLRPQLRACFGSELLPYSLLEFRYDVSISSRELVASGFQIQVVEGAPLPSAIDGCIRSVLAGPRQRSLSGDGGVAPQQSFRFRTRLRVGNMP